MWISHVSCRTRVAPNLQRAREQKKGLWLEAASGCKTDQATKDDKWQSCRTRVAPHLHGCSGNEEGQVSLAELDSSMLSRTALHISSSVQYSVQHWTERACCCIIVYLITMGLWLKYGSCKTGAQHESSTGIFSNMVARA